MADEAQGRGEGIQKFTVDLSSDGERREGPVGYCAAFEGPGAGFREEGIPTLGGGSDNVGEGGDGGPGGVSARLCVSAFGRVLFNARIEGKMGDTQLNFAKEKHLGPVPVYGGSHGQVAAGSGLVSETETETEMCEVGVQRPVSASAPVNSEVGVCSLPGVTASLIAT